MLRMSYQQAAQEFSLPTDKEISKNEIKKRYRELSKKYHPDLAGGSKAKMQLINQANEILMTQSFLQGYQSQSPNQKTYSSQQYNQSAQNNGFNEEYKKYEKEKSSKYYHDRDFDISTENRSPLMDSIIFISRLRKRPDYSDIKIVDVALDRLSWDTDLNINDQDTNGNTALMYAIKYLGYFHRSQALLIIKKMLNIKNIDINIKNKRGMTALDFAKHLQGKVYEYFGEEVIRLLIKKGAYR